MYNLIYENIEKLNEIFPPKAYEKLEKYKEENDIEEFNKILEVVFESNQELKAKIKELETKEYHSLLSPKRAKQIFFKYANNIKDSSLIDKILEELNYYYPIIKEIAEATFNFSIEVLYSLFVKNEEIDEERIANLFSNLSKIYIELHEIEDAIEFQKKAIKVLKNSPNIEINLILDAIKNLVEIYTINGEYNEALKQQKLLIEYVEKIGDKNSLQILYTNLAIIYELKKDYIKALDIQLKALEIAEKIFDKDSINLAYHYNNLASIYHYLDEYKKALKFGFKALNIREEKLDKNHYDLANTYNNLSMIYGKLKEYTEALDFSYKALNITEKILDKNHPDLATSYNNISEVYIHLKKYEKAREFQIKAINIRKKIFDKNHPHLIYSYDALSNILNKIIKKIDSIKIQNFKLLKDFELTLSDKLNILIGENSKGKTSLLQAITLGLLDEFSIGTYQEKFEKYITKNEKSSTITLNFNNYSKTLKIYPNKKEFNNNYFKPFILAYGSNIFTIYDKSGDDIAEEIVNKKGKNYFVESIFKDYHNGLYNPKNVLKSLDYLAKEEKNKQRVEEVKKEFIEVINHFLDNFKLVDKKNGKYFFENKFEKELKLEDLSEGYRNNILLISDIMIHILSNGETSKTIKGFILIDEFDRHLHPTWQSKLVTKLKETFPNIQFILTTHNPMSILDREPEEIINLEITQDGIKAVKKEIGTKTIDVGTVLLVYFGVESVVGESMQKDLDRFYELKVNDETETKEFKKLEEQLQNTIANSYINDYGYYKFLKFLKEKNINIKEDIDDEKLKDLMEEFKDML